MKKLISMTVAIVSALSLCMGVLAAESPDAYTVYKRAMKKLDEAATIQTTATYEVAEKNSDYSYDSEEARITLTQTQAAGKKLQMEARMFTEDSGTALYVYYKDGYYYQRIVDDNPNIKRKTKMSEQKAIVECFGLDRSLGRKALEDATLEKTNDGYTLKYQIAGKDFGGLYVNAMAELYNEDALIMKNSAITYTLNIGRDGTLKSYKISFTTLFYDLEYDDVVNLANRISCTVTTDGKAKKINYPSNLDAYKLSTL